MRGAVVMQNILIPKRVLPGTDINLSVVGLGTWVMGGFQWGNAPSIQDCQRVFKTAHDAGINWVDTAPVYGFGRSEEIVGRCLSKQREKWWIASKCGLSFQGKRIRHDLSNSAIRRGLEESLSRLRTDYLDLYQCHWPDPEVPLDDALETLSKLQSEGKIRSIGVSHYAVEELAASRRKTFVKTVQEEISLLKPLVSELREFCDMNHTGIIAYGVLGGGILTGKYRKSVGARFPDAKAFYGYYEDPGFSLVRNFLDECRELNKPLNQIALRWVLNQPGISFALVGCRDAEQLKNNLEAFTWTLSEREWAHIEQSLTKLDFQHASRSGIHSESD